MESFKSVLTHSLPLVANGHLRLWEVSDVAAISWPTRSSRTSPLSPSRPAILPTDTLVLISRFESF